MRIEVTYLIKKNSFGNKAVAIALAIALFCCSGTIIRAQEGKPEKEILQEELQLYAQAAVLMDADSGRVLYGKNEDAVLPMASTTKIMTCILALEYGDPEQIAEVSAYAAGMPKVKLYVRQGEKFRLRDLLYSLMLESHNDSAVVVAEAVGGSVEKFAAMMNQKARDIGCFDTYFITPNGLDATVNETGKTHATTAADLAKIMAYCVTDSPKKEEFLEITRTLSYDFTDVDGSRSFHCSNHNAFLGMMQEALSGKTGFTNNAGYCYVGAIKSEDRIFTVALLACGWPNNRSYKWSDMKKLAAYGMEHYHYQDIYEEKTFADIPVRGGIAGEARTPWDRAYVGVTMEKGVKSLSYLLSEEDQIEVKTRVETVLDAPVAAGEKVGEVSYYLNGELVKRYDLLAEKAVEEQSFLWILQYIVNLAIFF